MMISLILRYLNSLNLLGEVQSVYNTRFHSESGARGADQVKGDKSPLRLCFKLMKLQLGRGQAKRDPAPVL